MQGGLRFTSPLEMVKTGRSLKVIQLSILLLILSSSFVLSLLSSSTLTTSAFITTTKDSSTRKIRSNSGYSSSKIGQYGSSQSQTKIPFFGKSNRSSSKSNPSLLRSSTIDNIIQTNGETTEGIEVKKIQKPRGSPNNWEVHKFGGASLANAELYRTVGDLILTESEGRPGGGGRIPTMAIVSAMGGMTDLLVNVVDKALVDFESAKDCLEMALERAINVLHELAPKEITDPIIAGFRSDADDILSVVQSLRMIQTVPAVSMEVVSGFGEIWSAQMLHAYLRTKGVPCAWIDARDVLVVRSDNPNVGLGEKGEASTGGVVPVWDQTTAKMLSWWENVAKAEGLHDVDYTKESPIVVVTGFVARTADGVPTTLKRSGSDYSATLFAKLTSADRVTMWKNTDGVYTADPRRVPDAFPIPELKYDEAMELAYFGAQVLHPSAMVPCIDDNIPVYVRNIFNPSFKGTVIRGRCRTLGDMYEGDDTSVTNGNVPLSDEIAIKGITSVDKTALLTLEGASVMGGATAAERFMAALSRAGINVLIITQASSESSITVAVPENEAKAGLKALREAFELELARSTVNSVRIVRGMSIIAIVGEGMASRSGVSATFMSSLARADVNIRLIAQGSSERQIAVVVDGDQASKALRAAHMAFTLSETTVSVAVLGATGQIGSCLLNQLNERRDSLADDLNVEIRVNAAANSRKMTYCENAQGMMSASIADVLSAEKDGDDVCGDCGEDSVFCEDVDLDILTERLVADVNPHRVIIDCTNNDDVAEYYQRWVEAGINIISPGRKAGAGPLDRYRSIQNVLRKSSAIWQLEGTVGAGLPILTTLQDIQETGDKVERITGCVSGTMAYIFRTMFDDDIAFSEAVKRAVDKGFTETDLREDLEGWDTARKVVILARQAGLEVEVDDVEVGSILDGLFEEGGDGSFYDDIKGGSTAITKQLLDDIKVLDKPMAERMAKAREKGKALRYKFVIEATGRCRCGLFEVSNTDPLFRLKSNENLVSFKTKLYKASPLIVKGAAAGSEMAATAIFSDLLRIARAYSSFQM